MGFNLANLTRLLLTTVAAVLACSGAAQDAAPKPGQPILFSSPDNDTISSNMPSLAAKPPGAESLADTVKSPTINLDAALPAVPLPQPQQPHISPEQSRRMKRLLEERENWSLLTPEEILGLPTREKILGIPDDGGAGQSKDESVVVQYYERQERLRNRTNNYDYHYDFDPTNGAPHWDFAGNRELQMNPDTWPPAGAGPQRSTVLAQLLARSPSERTDSNPDQEHGWSRPFNLPVPPPAPTPEQQVAMEQFQQLLKLHAPPGGVTKTSPSGNRIFSASSTAFGSAPGQPAVTPIGASYTPLSSGLSAPASFSPIPGLPGLNNPALLTTPPAWTPSPPPWESTTPQLGVMPPRKF